MIDVTAIEQTDRKRVVCVTVVDGKEYARLVAFANALNGFPGLETDNTPATVYANFFAFPCNLDDDAGEAAAQIAESIDLGDFDDPQEERLRIRELQNRLIKATGENSQLEAVLARCEAAEKDTSTKTKEETDHEED